MLFPLMFSQILQRLFHIIDNRFVGELGSTALLIHNIQYNFIVFGQSLGVAGATATLIFWNRKEYENEQRSLLNWILLLSGGAAFFFILILFNIRRWIATQYGIPSDSLDFSQVYVGLGLINMFFYSKCGCLDGMLIASGNQKKSFFLAGFLVIGNLIGDYLAIHFLYGESSSQNGTFSSALMGVGITTTILLSITVTIAGILVFKKSKGTKILKIPSLLSTWLSELGIVLIRSISPFIYAYLLARSLVGSSLIVTYNLALHLAYLACLPLAAGIQLAVRDLSKEISLGNKEGRSSWWIPFLSTALFPTIFLLLFMSLNSRLFLTFAYGVAIQNEQIIFVRIFFLSCLIGQVGHIFSMRLRANKKSHIVIWGFFASEFGVHLALPLILILLDKATPLLLGLSSVASSVTYLLLNIIFSKNLRSKHKDKMPLGLSTLEVIE